MTWLLLIVLFLFTFTGSFLVGHYLGWKQGRYGMKPTGPDIGRGVHPHLHQFAIFGKGPLEYEVVLKIDHVLCRVEEFDIRSITGRVAPDGELIIGIQLVKNVSQYGAG